VKAGHLCLASLVTLQMVKGRSAECSVVQCFTNSWSLPFVVLQSSHLFGCLVLRSVVFESLWLCLCALSKGTTLW